jgi:hypothetical protein
MPKFVAFMNQSRQFCTTSSKKSYFLFPTPITKSVKRFRNVEIFGFFVNIT